MGTELLNSEFSLHSPPPAEDVCHRSPLHGLDEARLRPGHLPPAHLLRQAGHLQRRQVHRSWCRHCWCRWIRSWYWICVRIPHHWLRQEPLPQAAAFLLRYPWIRFVRGHGSVLFDDGLPSALRFLRSEPIHLIYTGGVVLI